MAESREAEAAYWRGWFVGFFGAIIGTYLAHLTR